jgi:hypothetical protein
MGSIVIASQRDWILMQFAPRQNSSGEPGILFRRTGILFRRTGIQIFDRELLVLCELLISWRAQGESNPCFRRERGITRTFTNLCERCDAFNALYIMP